MAASPREILAAVAPHVPAALVPPPARAAIADFAAALPSAFNWLGFECRLAEDDEQVDFAGCCEVWGGGRRRLAEALTRDPSLAGAAPCALVLDWVHPDSPLHATCPAVWLEFDFIGRGPPVPFAFLCVDPACTNTFSTPGTSPPPSLAQLDLLVEHGARLLSAAVPDAALAAFRRCAAVLPPGARALHVAATPHRGHDDLRMHFAMLSRDVPGWLAQIGWPGDLAQVHDALDMLGNEFRQVGVQLAAGAQLRPLLGIEAYVARGPAEFPAWTKTFAALTTRGICAPAKAQALFRWWGTETTALPGSVCPVRLSRQFYLKLVLSPGTLAAKAYLAIFPENVLM